jgi:hypothetical protein
MKPKMGTNQLWSQFLGPLMILALSLHLYSHKFHQAGYQMFFTFTEHLTNGFQNFHHHLVTPRAGEENFRLSVREFLQLAREFQLPDFSYSEKLAEDLELTLKMDELLWPIHSIEASKYKFLTITELVPSTCHVLAALQETQLVQCL